MIELHQIIGSEFHEYVYKNKNSNYVLVWEYIFCEFVHCMEESLSNKFVVAVSYKLLHIHMEAPILALNAKKYRRARS